MERRNFLAGILAAGMAPAIVRAESLMRIVVPKIYMPDYAFGTGDFTYEAASLFSQQYRDALANCDIVKIMETGGWLEAGNEIWKDDGRLVVIQRP